VGGYLAVMLALTLREQGKAMPGAIGSISPWCDLEISNATIETKNEADKLLSSVCGVLPRVLARLNRRRAHRPAGLAAQRRPRGPPADEPALRHRGDRRR
jgi:hypothetical protein